MLYGLSGPITVKGRTYNGVMPNQGNVMKDYEIAGVLTYVRNSWGNKADTGKPPAITASVVRAARAEGRPAQDERHRAGEPDRVAEAPDRLHRRRRGSTAPKVDEKKDGKT